MRAGVASNAAITSARSSEACAALWSISRNGAGLSLGTLRLGDQPFDQPVRLAFAPVLLAKGAIASLALGIDKYGHRESTHPPRIGRLFVRVEKHRQLEIQASKET